MIHLGSLILKNFKSPLDMEPQLVCNSSLKSTIHSPISAFQLFYMVLGFIMQLYIFLSWLSTFHFFPRRRFLWTYSFSLECIHILVSLSCPFLGRIFPMWFFLFPQFIWINNVKGDHKPCFLALNNCSKPFWLKARVLEEIYHLDLG